MAEQAREKVKNPIVDALLKHYEKSQWQPFFDILGLNEESSDHLVKLLIIHLLLDRLLAHRLAVRLVENRKLTYAIKFTEILKEVAGLTMAKRIALAVKLRAISAKTGGHITEINRVRNACVHYNPKSKHGWNLDRLPEIATKNGFEVCSKRGFAALRELLSHLKFAEGTSTV